jgi:hypothetical protein
MLSRGYSRLLRIWETNYGRDAGWTIERHGQPIALLTEPRWEDMFWDSYRLEVLTEDAELHKLLLTKEFWIGSEWSDLTMRNREFGELAPFAFPAGEPFTESGRLMVRGLYFVERPPGLLDHIELSIRRWGGRGQTRR